MYMTRIIRYGSQLGGSLLILAFVPGNFDKLLALLILWALTFFPVSRAELVFTGVICLLFSLLNIASLHQAIFAFAKPDWLGMPVYELFMWGFYLLHVRRMLDGPEAPAPGWLVWTLAGAYALTFAAVAEPYTLMIISGSLLLFALTAFHRTMDFVYVGYMVLLGAAVEYTGVHSGLWRYPIDVPGGVPGWFITLWGGVGFFLRRLALPYLARFERDPVAT